MSKSAEVIEVHYKMGRGQDYTEARVRTPSGDVWVRELGYWASPDLYWKLIELAGEGRKNGHSQGE